MGLFLGGEQEDPDTGEDRMKHWSKVNRAERLLDNEDVRMDIVLKMLDRSPTLKSVVGMIDHIGDKRGQELIEKLAKDASDKYANEYFKMQKARRAKRDVPTKNLPDIELEKLKDSEYLAQLFAQIIISSWDDSELLREIMRDENDRAWTTPVANSIRRDLPKSFLKEYSRSVMTLGPEKVRSGPMDFYYQKKQALETFPELAGLIKALTYLDEKEGFTAADVHSMNVMFSKKTREMVVVDLGLFKIKKAPGPEPVGLTPSEFEPFELVLERFKWFLEK